LADVPTYSEIFFRNKIRLLLEEGIEVVILSDKKNSKTTFDLCAVRYAPQLKTNKVLRVFQIAGYLAALFVTHPLRLLCLLKANADAGFTMRKRFNSVIRSYHILRENLDWLQFGFGTMAIGRENVAKVIRAKMAASFRGFDIAIYPLKNPGCYSLLWMMVDKIHTISDDLSQLVRFNGYPTTKSLIKIAPAIDVARFVRTSTYNNLRSPLQFVTISRLFWKKGLEYTLEALSLFKSAGVAFHYTIVGEGNDLERLIFTTYQLGLRECVTFAGKQDQDNVIKILEQADIYLQYSIQEGFCNAVLEAQAMGMLCIVSNADGLSENVLHGQTGWVVPKRNPEALSRQIKSIIQMEESELKEIRDRAVKRVRETFNLDRQKREFLDFYELENMPNHDSTGSF
jgi:colanic acid/amylovoran biosynthesis glycosyltransferase